MMLVHFILCISLLAHHSLAITPSSQIQALQSLYNSTNGENWVWKNENVFGRKWSFTLPQADPCNDNSKTWQGITCSSPANICRVQACVITSIRLGDYGLFGPLPSDIFPSLTSLSTFQITSSNLTGTVPTSIGSLTNLRMLSFTINRLTGSIPTVVGSLQNLQFFDMSLNRLTGTIPYQLESLSLVTVLYLQWNDFIGSIPSNLGKMSSLDIAFFGVNRLSGSIPSELGSLSVLSIISFEDNLMSGPIPPELSSLSQLVGLNFCKNKFTGSIPSELFQLTKLRDLQFTQNFLSHTIPHEVSSLTKLTLLALDYNQFTGAIPPELGSLGNLAYLDISNNLLSGSIPSEFGSLTNLQTVFLALNQFSQAIPSEMGSLTLMRNMYLFENFFTGSLPNSLSQLTNLLYFHFYNNHFSGKISFSLYSFPSLRQFFLQQNSLSGNLHQLLPAVNPNLNSSLSSNSSLVNFDVSDNLLSGSIPSSLFYLPHLLSISLSLNCFQHELPPEICEAKQVEVLSMDGLGSSEHCHEVVSVSFLFFHSVNLGQAMDGTIPECIWRMTNVGTLNLAGNGLRGEIGSDFNMSSLLKMTLSHNYLSGVIPFWLQEKVMYSLDLSHNKFRGDIRNFKSQQFHTPLVSVSEETPIFLQRSLKLTVNRLSGDLFDTLDQYWSLDILSGNLFSCQDTPKTDLNSKWTTCGSKEYDQAMSGMGGVLVLLLIVILFYCFCFTISSLLPSGGHLQMTTTKRTVWFHCDWFENRFADFHLLIQYVRYYSVSPMMTPALDIATNLQSHLNVNEKIKSVISFGYLLSYFMKSICFLTFLSILLSLPIYILKEMSGDSDEGSEEDHTTYVTHDHMYHWLWTMAFLSGPTPAIILLSVTLICLLLFSLILNQIVDKDSIFSLSEARFPSQSLSTFQQSDSTLGQTGDSNLSYPSELIPNGGSERNLLAMASVWVIFLLNIIVVGTVNGLYLWSTLVDLSPEVRIWIQVGLGFFTFVWSALILQKLLSSRIKESRYGVWLFTCLSVMNNVIIPCLVTALSSPSCYQRLLVPADDISSTYSYRYCSDYIYSATGEICLKYQTTIMPPLSINPPFTYSYQCGSALLTSYLPVYMYSISLQLLSIFCQSIMIFSVSLTTLPSWWMNMFPGVYWPLRGDSLTPTPPHPSSPSHSTALALKMIKPHKVITFAINNTILLLSFGLCSPVLSCYITLSLCVNLSFHLLTIGRFISLRLLDHSCLPRSYKGSRSNSQQRDHHSQSIQSNEQLIILLNQQVEGAHASFKAGKWPVVFTSIFFITLLCWDMVGDQVGWYSGLWVPIVGFAMVLILWIWERLLVSGVFLSIPLPSALKGILSPSRQSNSFELAISSLHRPQNGVTPSQTSEFSF